MLEGNVVCGTMSNLFLQARLDLDDPVARSLRYRRRHAPLGARAGAACLRLRPLAGPAALARQSGEAEEVFMTNAVAGIVSVALIHDGAARICDSRRPGRRARAARAPGARL